MDVGQDEQFFKQLIPIFQEEAAEHLKALSKGLLELEKPLDEKQYESVIEEIFREAHSLKGASRSVNKRDLQEICQVLENVFAALKQKKIQLSAEAFDILHRTIETLKGGIFSALSRESISSTVKQLSSVIEKTPQPLPLESSPPLEKKVIQAGDKTIRVSIEKLNVLFQEIEETLMIKLFFHQQLSDLKQLMAHLRKGSMDESSRLLSKLIKNGEQNSHFVATLVDNLLEDAKKILMQPASTLFDLIPLMVRDIGRDLGKEVRVEITGENIEVDRRVLEEIKDPIIHIIRNAIDHGIEKPEERIKNNKPPFGTIKIETTQSEGHHVFIRISDDGKGFDLAKLKTKAIKKGLISEKEANEMSDEKVCLLAFHTDISTSPMITELSGRGIGLGIVSEKVDKLGGQIKVETKLGQGACFILTLPLTRATFRGVHIVVGDSDFILPTHSIKRVLRTHVNEIKKLESKQTIVIENQVYSFVYLADLLGIPPKNSSYFFSIMIKAAEQTIVFGADTVHSEREILLKSLGPQCVRVKNIMAATIMERGNIIPVLNPSDLVKSAMREGVIVQRPSKESKKEKANQSILVVEDSMTTRLLLKNILTNASYKVTTAVDGVEALEVLKGENFDLLLTDVEMPRMDGFKLLEKVRSIDQFKKLPIIICTALGSRQDRERGIDLGANAYIDKSAFNEQSLISIVQKLI